MKDTSIFEGIKAWTNERGEHFRAQWTGAGFKMSHLENGAWIHYGNMTARKNASVKTLNDMWEAEA